MPEHDVIHPGFGRVNLLRSLPTLLFIWDVHITYIGIISDIQSKKYIVVETYRRGGQAIRTPVWFFVRDGLVYVVTRSGTGKVKRLRNNTRVRIAECTIKGKVIGPWASGTATILNEQDTKEAVRLRGKKYGIMAKMATFLSSGKGDLLAFSIRPD